MVTYLTNREVCEYVVYLSFRSVFGILKMLPSKLGKHGQYKTVIELPLLETTYHHNHIVISVSARAQ